MDATRAPTMTAPPARYSTEALVDFAFSLLESARMEAGLAEDVAEILVEADLIGRDTHGLALLAGFLSELDKGRMTRIGGPEVLAERTVAATWDGDRLPGPALVRQAIEWARPRARDHGTATVAIRRSHHVGCLGAYLEPVARAGLLIEIFASDPAGASVAPFGGTQGVLTPNPMAVGIPTTGDPILVDLATSVTSPQASGRLRAARARGRPAWWLDALGQPTDDPGVLFGSPAGTILPLGGLDAGHKGFGLALMVEALTGGLAGFGRADVVDGWGATVCVRLSDPDAFGGLSAFTWQTDWLVQACRGSAARDGSRPVRLPGERALALKREQLEHGIALHASILPALLPWSKRLHATMPVPL